MSDNTPRPASGHALAGNMVLYSELRRIDRFGTWTYHTRCGRYVRKDMLAFPRPGQGVTCPECQAAREEAYREH
jgi:hypothetical protein